MLDENNKKENVVKVSSAIKYGDLEDTIKIPVIKSNNNLENTQEFNFGLEADGDLNDN
ncbi:MAG: hypothetical protein IJA94_06015 [Bacilli bacterium]|nr:hypothetical protein [Bacilli bacterium]